MKGFSKKLVKRLVSSDVGLEMSDFSPGAMEKGLSFVTTTSLSERWPRSKSGALVSVSGSGANQSAKGVAGTLQRRLTEGGARLQAWA